MVNLMSKIKRVFKFHGADGACPSVEYGGYRYYIQDDRLDDGRWVYDFMRQKHCDVRGRFHCKESPWDEGYWKVWEEIRAWLHTYGEKINMNRNWATSSLTVIEVTDKDESPKSTRLFAVDEHERGYINLWEFARPERLSIHAYETYAECLTFAKEYMEDLTRENEGEQLSLFDM